MRPRPSRWSRPRRRRRRRSVPHSRDLRRRRVRGAPARTCASPARRSGRSSRSTVDRRGQRRPRSRLESTTRASRRSTPTRPARSGPQSLIGENYVDCDPGTLVVAAAAEDRKRPRQGQLLPAGDPDRARRSTSDIVQDISQQPITQRLALILDELGTGLAARGSDLNAVIHRANPALGQTDQVLKILARQNRALAKLATDSRRGAGAARAKRKSARRLRRPGEHDLGGERRARRRHLALDPAAAAFLRQLRPLMADLGQARRSGHAADDDARAERGGARREFQNLTPFANAAAAGADRARQRRPAVASAAGGDAAAGASSEPAGHSGRPDRDIARQADLEPRPDRRDRAADVAAVLRRRARPTASTASATTSAPSRWSAPAPPTRASGPGLLGELHQGSATAARRGRRARPRRTASAAMSDGRRAGAAVRERHRRRR